MANYLSSPYQVVQPQSSVNVPLLATVLQAKQGRYDVAKTEIQQTINALGNLDLLRDSDKEYASAKISDTVAKINSFGNRDLSLPGVGDEILGTVKAIANDGVILNALENTQKYRSFQNQVAQIREKKPELYSDINYSYALDASGFNQYMSGQTDKIGNIQYTNYSDVNKKINDLVLDLETKKKDQKIQVQDGNGQIIETTISGLSPEQIRQVAQNYLNPDDKKQIQINGWHRFGGYSDTEGIKNKLGQFLSVDTSNIDNNINRLQLELDGGGLSQQEYTKKNSELESYKAKKSDLAKNKEYLLNNPVAAVSYMETELFYQDTIQRFSPLYTQTVEYRKDDNYWARRNYELEQAKFEYEKEKDTKKEKTANEGSLILGNVPTDLQSTINVENDIDTEIETTATQLNNNLEQYRSQLQSLASSGDVEAQRVMSIYENSVSNKKTNETDLEVFNKVVQQNIKTNSNLQIIGNKNYMSDIRALDDKQSVLLGGRKAAIDAGKQDHIAKTLDNQETLSAFFNNPQTTMIWYNADGREGEYSVRDVLINNGVIDRTGKQLKSLNQVPGVLLNLQKSYYAADYLTNNRQSSLNELSRLLGETPSSTVTVDSTPVYTTSSAGVPTQTPSRRTIINPNTKTGQFLNQARTTNLGRNTLNPFASDKNLASDDRTIGRFLNTDYKNSEAYKNALLPLHSKLASTQVVGVLPTDENNFQRLQALANGATSEVPTTFNKDEVINIREDGDYVILYQNQTETAGKNKGTTTSRQTRVLKQDFQNNIPALSQRLNFNATAGFYTEGRGQDRLVSESIKFFTPETNSKLYKYNEQVTLRNKPESTVYLRSEDAKSNLNLKYAQPYRQSFPELPQVIENAINNSSNFSVVGSIQRDFNNQPYLELNLKDSNGATIYTEEVNGVTNADEFQKIIQDIPQVFYGTFVEQIIKKQIQSKTATGRDTPAYLSLIKNTQQ